MNELIKAKRLTEIAYSDRPLSQGGEIIILTPDKLQEKFKFFYTESLWGAAEKLHKYFLDQTLLEEIKSRFDLPKESAILQRLKIPLGGLVICNMKEEGFGLFTMKLIKKGTVLFAYAGNIEDSAVITKEASYYSYVWGNKDPHNTEKVINAKERGGLARFLQHLPQDEENQKKYYKDLLREKFGKNLEEEINIEEFIEKIMVSTKDHELDEVVFKDPGIIKTLATSNVRLSLAVVKNKLMVVCWAQFDIQPTEQLGFSYGSGYWPVANIKPRYFDKRGKLILRNQYYYKSEIKEVADSSFLNHNQKLDPKILYREGLVAYQNRKYNQAIIKIDEAFQSFKSAHRSEFTLDCGSCYSSLASCYRELKFFARAIAACENAIVIFYYKDTEGDKLSIAISKYRQCLAFKKFTEEDLYKIALEQYHKQQYPVAKNTLQSLIENFIIKTDEENQAYYHSTLASCNRALEEIDEAVEHCQKALGIRRKIYKEDHKLIKDTETKLDNLILQQVEDHQSKKNENNFCNKN